MMEDDCMRKMSKLFMFVALIGLYGGGKAFSQNLSFHGFIASGLGINLDNKQLLAVENFVGTPAGYFSLNPTLDNEEKTAGISANLSVMPGWQARENLSPVMPWFYGYTKLWDELVTIEGGLLKELRFTTGELVMGNTEDGTSALGGLVILKPHSTVQVGLGAYLGLLTDYETINPVHPINGMMGVKAENGLYAANVAFSLPNVFDLIVGYRLPFTDESSDPVFHPDPVENPDRFIASVKLTAIDNVSLVLEADLEGISDNAINALYGLSASYTRNDLKLGLNSVLRNDDRKGELYSFPDFPVTTGDDPYLGFMLYGTYTIGSLIPRADFFFGLGGTGPNDYYWQRFFRTNVSYNFADKFFAFRPSVMYKFTPLMSVEGGALLNVKMPEVGDMKLVPQIYLSFLYMF
jgi:hypothetical protein